MSEAPQKKDLRPELRIFIASALSIIVILLWAKFFAPKPPAQTPQPNKPRQFYSDDCRGCASRRCSGRQARTYDRCRKRFVPR